jgi:2-hydroxychromene-2-carboxylate isomerase
LALQVAIAVRDQFPERFLALHGALFSHRHDQGGSLRDEQALRNVLKATDVDDDLIFAEVASGRPLATVKAEHTASAEQHKVWGVPTFIVGGEAAFVRVMHRPEGDGAEARRTVERVVDLLSWPDLNEFKHTSIPR